jgi:hypothetical protein
VKQKLLLNFWFTIFAVGALLAFIPALAALKGYPVHSTMLISGLIIATAGAIAFRRQMHRGSKNGK